MLKTIFFSRITKPISTKLGRIHAWGPIRGKIRKSVINLQKSSSHEPQAGMH